MPIVSVFFGIIIRRYYDGHIPPHMHVEYQNKKAVLDFRGNIFLGELGSKTALRLVCEWIGLHEDELYNNWEIAEAGQEIKPIAPLK